MTVAELRALLETFDQDLPVALIDDGFLCLVESVDVERELWDATPDKPIVIIW